MSESALYVASTGFKVQPPRFHRPHRSPHRQFRHGKRAGVVRAFTAARLYTGNAVPTLAAAAESCGSNVNYIRAAITLLKVDDPHLMRRVYAGQAALVPIRSRGHAARQVQEGCPDRQPLHDR
jgi:hypothetical protein